MGCVDVRKEQGVSELAVIEQELMDIYEEEGRATLNLKNMVGRNLEEVIEATLNLPQVDAQIMNTVAGGVYTRQMTVPAGTLVIGDVHKDDTINILSQGIISVITIDEKGNVSEPKTFKAPFTFVSEANVRKIGLVHEEVVFINAIHVSKDEEINVEDDEYLRSLFLVREAPYIEGEVA